VIGEFYKGYELNGLKLHSFKNKFKAMWKFLDYNILATMMLQFIIFECNFSAQRYKSATKPSLWWQLGNTK